MADEGKPAPAMRPKKGKSVGARADVSAHPAMRERRLAVTLGTAPAPDGEVTLVAIRRDDLTGSVHGGKLTLASAVDVPAPAGMAERAVTHVFLVAPADKGAPKVLASAPLVTAIRFGAGHGLHLPPRSVVF